MNNAIEVTISSPTTLLDGPVPANLAVRNISAYPVEILLPYPNPNGLAFECHLADAVAQKVVEKEEIERSRPVSVPAGGTYTVPYFLNRYLRFKKPAEGEVKYHLETAVRIARAPGDSGQFVSLAFDGSFRITVRKSSEAELRGELARYAGHLSGGDPELKKQSAEALAFLDTPISVDYVEHMLSVGGLEAIGVKALGRFPSPKTYELITGMLAHKDSAIVSAALDEIDRVGIPVERKRVQELLMSTNENTRWRALGWLSARPDRLDLPLVTRLIDDPNEQVRRRARAYADSLIKP